MMNYVENKPLAEMFHLLPEEYADVSVSSLPFSVRVQNRFRQKNIATVKDLLLLDVLFLKNIQGFGDNCLSQVLDYCKALSVSNAAGEVATC